MCGALGVLCVVGVVGVAVAVAVGGARANDNVTVVRKQLSLEEEYTLLVDHTIEYMLQFVPSSEQSKWPSRVWVRSGGGDAARPLLVTARQLTGAITWQLPYRSGEQLLYELERTLCPPDSADSADTDVSDCAGDAASTARGEFTLHVASACAAPFAVTLRAAPARDAPLALDAPATVTAAQAAPRVYFYKFLPDQDSVRLVVESEDDVCATIAVQSYTCPIAETLEEMETSSLRMTVLRSGGVQIARRRYPRGFYVVTAVHGTDAACVGEEVAEEATGGTDWLWDAAVWERDDAAPPDAPTAATAPPARAKRLTLLIKASLSRAQYLVGAGATLAACAAFYAALGALALARRWPRCARLVAPRAVLADTNKSENGTATAADTPDSALTPAQPRRRRDSTATFDSSDNSDTDSDDPATATTATTATTAAESSGAVAAPEPLSPRALSPTSGVSSADGGIAVIQLNDQFDTGGDQRRPFGLPARLHVAALARRRARVLRARSDRYLYALYTVAVFYALPVLQFVAAFQLILNASGTLDLCYYNFLCAHPLGELSDFNHVFSNLGYLLLGALFMLQVRRRRVRRARAPAHQEYGLPPRYGMLSSLGAGMMMVALLSASYHVCPNRLNFQFDTAFMYVLAVLSMVNIYQSRHPDINARAHATFGVLAVLIALVVWGVLGGGPLFWSVFTVLHVFTFLLLSLRIYYVGQFRLEKESLSEAARALATLPRRSRPLYAPRLAALLLANAVNWAFALYGLVNQTADIASHLLGVLLCNALLHMVFYLTMKLLHGERPRWYAWVHLAAAAAAWAPALYFFTSGSTDWSTTPALSRHRNHECRVLHFYDSHDLWHLLSAVALYFTFNAMLTWDDGLAAVRRTEIAVF